MKKLLLIFLILSISCSSTKETSENEEIPEDYVPKVDFLGRLEKEEIRFLKNNYKWADGEVLVINFKQPGSECHYDNSNVSRASRKWWKRFYLKVNRDNYSNIQVISDSHRVEKHIDNEFFFGDKDKFLLENFFNRRKSCLGVLVINEAGEYLQYNGEYSEKQVAKFIDVLS